MEKYKIELFEKELLKLYPKLSPYKAKEIIKQLFNFWENMIENVDLLK